MAGRSRTCGAPRFRRALYRLSYGHAKRAACPSVHRPLRAVDAAAMPSSDVSQRRSCCDVVQATRQPFDPGSPASGCASERSTSYVEGLWSPSRGHSTENGRQKHTLNAERTFQRGAPRVFLSQAGPRSDLELFELSIILLFVLRSRLRNDEGDLPVALTRSRYAPRVLAHALLREGHGVVEQAAVEDGLLPARRRRDDSGRLGDE